MNGPSVYNANADMCNRVLVVDDDPHMRSALKRALHRRGCEVVLAGHGTEALAHVEQGGLSAFAVAIVDMCMPGMSGLDVLTEIKNRSPETQVIILTGFGTIDLAVRAMRAGANDFLEKPFDSDLLWERIATAGRLWGAKHTSDSVAAGPSRPDPFRDLIGSSVPMQRIRRLASRMGASAATLLIQGESGTGKGEFARAVHASGPRRAEPFVAVDLASISPDVIGSELFGHAKGAFTSANDPRTGLIRSAGRGTIFLDEIGELPLNLQVNLLRVIQERQVRPIGSEDVHAVEARLIAATNRNLATLVRRGLFREDLFHRLNVVEVTLPPLRERPSDIPELAQHFLLKYQEERPAIAGYSPDALTILMDHDWPGNVRELENAVLRAIVIGTSDTIEPGDFPLQVTQATGRLWRSRSDAVPRVTGSSLELEPSHTAVATLADHERDAIVAALAETDGHRERAAHVLGIGVATLYRKLKRYGIR